jgi:hypothetical protein
MRAHTAERDARVVEMRKAGLTYREIAASLGIDAKQAHECFKRGVAAIPREQAEEMRVISQGRQDFVTRAMMQVITAFHPVVNNGQIIFNPETGEMFDDPMPKIAAAKILVGVDERFARLFGLDAPRTTVKIEIDQLDAEIRRLESELGEGMPRGDGGMDGSGPQPARKAIEGPPGFR